MENLEVLRTLGAGAFGLVKLVKLKGSEPKKTYALKCLSKVAVVQNGFQDHVLREKTIMEELDHPFILKIHSAMQDSKNVYFLLEVLLGGELFKLLRDETQFPESCSQFYAASVLSALCYIHERKIAYRDLKPENLVLDAYGFVKLVDFGLAKKIRDGKTWTLCGTPDYLAPEVILNEGHDWAVDYWALGVLIYELTSGYAPFFAEEPMGVYENIVFGRTLMPPSFSLSLQDLLRKLLRSDQSKRLGRTKGGAAAVMKHPWFFSFDWCALRERRHEVPLKPKVKNAEDTSNFDPCEDDTTVVVSPLMTQ